MRALPAKRMKRERMEAFADISVDKIFQRWKILNG